MGACRVHPKRMNLLEAYNGSRISHLLLKPRKICTVSAVHQLCSSCGGYNYNAGDGGGGGGGGDEDDDNYSYVFKYIDVYFSTV